MISLSTRMLLAIMLFSGISVSGYADEQDIERPYSINLTFGRPEVAISSENTAPDFDLSRNSQINLGYDFNPWWGIETGISIVADNESEIAHDLAGSYQTTLSSKSALLGAHGYYPIADKFRGYLRLGGLAYKANLDLEETFDDVKEAGKDSATDNGFGYYYSLGFDWQPTKVTVVRIEYQRQELLDVFSDSIRSFDITYSGLALGIGIYF